MSTNIKIKHVIINIKFGNNEWSIIRLKITVYLLVLKY